jgi:cysteinyl-tRNA synthetase
MKRWDQKEIKINGVKCIQTYENVSPFRKFKQSYNNYWQLPSGIDELVHKMETARINKNWKVADVIRKSLTDYGIIVRNGKDWYPKQIEVEIKAEKAFTSWLYSTLSSFKSKEDASETKEYFDGLIKKEYDI